MIALFFARPRTAVDADGAFQRFYLGQVLGYAGDGLRTLAIPLLVFGLTGSAVSLGTTFALELLPYAIISLVGGSLADRVPRRPLMIVCDATRCAIMLLLALMFVTHTLSLAVIYVAVFLLASAGAIFIGAQSSSVPYLLGKDRTRGAVAALSGAENAINLIAPPLGGAMLASAGALPALLAIAGTYGASQFAIASVPALGPERPSGVPSLRVIAGDIRTGWDTLRDDPALYVLSWSQLFINLFGVMGWVAVIPYLEREFHFGDRGVGIAMGAIAAGSLAGSIVAGRTAFAFGRGLVIAYWLDALFWMPTIWTRSATLAIAAMALSSLFANYRVATMVAWRMRILPDEVVGRTFGVVRFFIIIGTLPGALAGGWISDHWGTRVTMAISALGFLVLAGSLTFQPAVRNDRR